jgi:hypothetical protein
VGGGATRSTYEREQIADVLPHTVPTDNWGVVG